MVRLLLSRRETVRLTTPESTHASLIQSVWQSTISGKVACQNSPVPGFWLSRVPTAQGNWLRPFVCWRRGPDVWAPHLFRSLIGKYITLRCFAGGWCFSCPNTSRFGIFPDWLLSGVNHFFHVFLGGCNFMDIHFSLLRGYAGVFFLGPVLQWNIDLNYALPAGPTLYLGLS